jgi:Undecaprenyl-phosphate galactose phosphotransferase WbaP
MELSLFQPAAVNKNKRIMDDKQSDYGNLPVRDYWNDRRVARRPYSGPDRRRNLSRRKVTPEALAANRREALHRFSLRKSNRLIQFLLMCGDVLCLVVALLIPAYTLGLMETRAQPTSHYLPDAMPIYAGVCIIFLAWNWLQGNYSRRCAFSDELAALLKAVCVAVGVQSTLAGFWGERSILLGLLLSWIVVLALVPLMRLGTKYWLFLRGAWTRPTVIIGSGDNALKTAEAIQSDWMLGFNIVEFISYENPPPTLGEGAITCEQGLEYRLVGGHKIPVRRVSRLDCRIFNILGNPHIVVATDTVDFWDIVRILYEQDVSYSSLNIAPPMAGIPMIGLGMTHVFKHDVLMMSVQNNLARFIPRFTKRLFDLVASVAIVIILAPFMLMIALAVASSGPQIIYGHSRVGRNGKTFKCYKFRSMVLNSQEVLSKLLAESPEAREEWDRDFKLKNDPRITWIGHFIRKTSLDELPQLFNVIRGDMSLVGPRPIVQEELDRYEDKRNLYHMVRPGITGLWQISGRNDISYRERVNLDSWYSKNWSLWYDIVILCKTIFVVFNRSGAY